jgi:hypothetical protein
MMDVEEDSKGDMMIDDNDQQGTNRDHMKEDTDADTDDPMNEIPKNDTVTRADLEDAKDRTNQDSLNEDTTMNDVTQLTDKRNQSENSDENSDREESNSDSSDGIVIVDQPEKEENNGNGNGNLEEEEMEVENDNSGPSEQFLTRTVDDEKTDNFVISKECQEDEKSKNSNSCSNDEVNDPLDSRDDIMIENNKEETVENEVVPVKNDSKSDDALDDTTGQIPKEKEELRLEPGNAYRYSVGDVVDLKSAHKGYVDKARITSVNPDNTYDVKIDMTGRQKKSVKPEQIIESSKNADLTSAASVHDKPNVEDTNEAGPSDIPQFIGGEPEDGASTPTRKSIRKRKTGRTDDERSVSTSSRSMRSKQGSPATRSSKQGPGTLRRMDEEEESGEEKSVDISVGGSVRSTASRPKRGAARRSVRNKNKDEDSTATAAKKPKIRAGLPPRPPKDSSKNTKNVDIENDDEVSVKSRVSTRSRSSTTARSSKQKIKNVDNDDDEVSVQSRVSARSRSSTARSSKRKNNAAENDDDDDDDEASVQSRVSARSRSSAARTSKQEAKLSSIAEDTIQNNVNFSKMTVKELQSECRKREISYSGLRKAALIEKLQSTMD